MNDIQILLELYKEQRNLGLHHETQRSKVSSLMLTAATILIGLIAFDDNINEYDLPQALAIFFLGIFGAFFTLKHYERFSFHRHRSRVLRKAIDAVLKCGELHSNENRRVRDEIRKSLDLKIEKSPHLLRSIVKITNRQYKYKGGCLQKASLHKFWASLHLFISVIGLLIAFKIIFL